MSVSAWLGSLTLIGSLLATPNAPAGVPSAQLEEISPTGRVHDVQRVEARFSEAMVSFGDPRAPAPVGIDCPVPGTARWVDPRTWVYEFERQLPAGIACRLRLRQGLRSLAGHPVAGALLYTFDTGGPRILETLPRGSSLIDEQQIFLLTLAAGADPASILEHARCAVAGESTPRRVALLTGARRSNLLARLDQPDLPTLVMVQCAGVLPPDRELVLSWGAGVRTPDGLAMDEAQLLAFRVRPPLFVQTRCADANESTDRCNPEAAIGVEFSVPIAREQAAALRLHGPGAVRRPRPFDLDDSAPVDAVWFAAPFPERVPLRVELPAGLVDTAGRPLSDQVASRLSVTTGQVAPVPFMELPAGDILEARAGAVLPLLLGNLTGDPRGRWLRLGDVATLADPVRADQALLDWVGRVAAWRQAKPGNRPALFGADDATGAFAVQIPRGRGPVVTGIDLPGPGFYVVELPATGAADAQATAVLVTNLAVQVKVGQEGPWVIWVTSLDAAQPVAGARIALTDACTSVRIGQGTTDNDGLARIAAPWPERTAGTPCPLGDQVLVSARTDDDLSFTLVADAGRRQASSGLLHTVFDRTLLRPGETLSMKHVLRRPVMDGFAIPQERPATLRIEHLGSGESYPLPLPWDSRGIAESTWAIPAGAHLGQYRLSTEEPRNGGDWNTGEYGFEIAEFRTPSMTARIEPPPEPLLSGDTPAVALTLAWLDGGPAAHWPVRLKTWLEEPEESASGTPLSAPEAFEDYDFAGGEVGDDAACQPREVPDPATPIEVTLDAGGQAQVKLPRLPQVCRPQTLMAVLDWQDANGESVSATRRLTLWPAAVRLGVRVLPKAIGEPLQLAVATIDPAGQPRAGQTVVVDLLRYQDSSHREDLGNGLYRDHTEHRLEFLQRLCTGQTDKRGVLRCAPRLAPIEESRGLIVRATGRDARQRLAVATARVTRAWPRIDLTALRQSAESDAERAVLERVERIAQRVPDAFGGTPTLQTADGRTDFAPGETAQLAVRMPFPAATALVTVEREGVLRAFVTRLAGDRPTLQLPIEARYAPKVTVSVLALRGRAADATPPSGHFDPGKPGYVRGDLELRVDPSPYRLEVAVHPSGEVHPVRALVPVRIQVRRADGQALPAGAEVAVAVVDEALLELLPNDSVALLEHMLSGRYNRVATTIAMDRVVGLRRQGSLSGGERPFSAEDFEALEDQINRMFQRLMGAGGPVGEPVGIVRTRFDTLLLWRARLPLDKRGNAEVSVPLNDSLSRFRIVAVATAGSGHFGTGQGSVRSSHCRSGSCTWPPARPRSWPGRSQFPTARPR